MLEILAITVPVFILIGLGYVAVRTAVLDEAGMRALGRFVIVFALPAMLFQALAQRRFDEIMNSGYLAAYALGSLTAFSAGLVLARSLRGRDAQASVMVGMGCSMSNSAFIGLPVALQVIGPIATVAMALTMLVENLLMLPLVLALADSSGPRQGRFLASLGSTLLGLARNPLLLAIVAGFGFSITGSRLPAPLFKAVDMLALASAPVALFVIGGTLAGARVRGMFGDVAVITVGKLLLHPAAVLVAVLLIPGIAPELQAGAVLFACMPMLSIYPIFGQKYGLETMCSAAVVVATVASFVSISVVIGLLGVWGMV